MSTKACHTRRSLASCSATCHLLRLRIVLFTLCESGRGRRNTRSIELLAYFDSELFAEPTLHYADNGQSFRWLSKDPIKKSRWRGPDARGEATGSSIAIADTDRALEKADHALRKGWGDASLSERKPPCARKKRAGVSSRSVMYCGTRGSAGSQVVSSLVSSHLSLEKWPLDSGFTILGSFSSRFGEQKERRRRRPFSRISKNHTLSSSGFSQQDSLERGTCFIVVHGHFSDNG